jgi:hypothetical protein
LFTRSREPQSLRDFGWFAELLDDQVGALFGDDGHDFRVDVPRRDSETSGLARGADLPIVA